MASTSSSSIMASSGANATSYDVFLSFRGEDTRNTFTDHLYEALVQAELHTFRDSNEISKGEELQQEIERAIKASKTSIIVISPKWTYDNVNRWKAALTCVSGLTGEVISGPEARYLKDIVDTIYHKLNRRHVYLPGVPPNYLIGMNTRHKQVVDSWLKSDTKFLNIYGIGGTGKKTLAKHIVYSNCHKFENISIAEEIDSRCKQPHDLLQLQKKILKDISGRTNRKIRSDWEVKVKIQEALSTRKALIFLGEIANEYQLEELLENGYINKESKIITTSRSDFHSRFWKGLTYRMPLLDDIESLELLSLHAFGSKIPIAGYEGLARRVIRYCGGNALALKLLGSYLAEDSRISSWKSALNLWEKNTTTLHDGIFKILIRSYELLPYDSDRELFLHIACFFIGEDKDYVEKILEHGFSALSRITTLTKRCLVSISPNQTLMMHPLLLDMARSIVIQESTKDPAKRSRVWRNEESYELLRNGKGSETVEGLALDMQMLLEDNYAFKESNLKTDAFKDMDKLKHLYLKDVKLSGSYDNFPETLRSLRWIGFNSSTIPCDLFMGNLVALDMSYSCLKVFTPPGVLQSLKILNLKDSQDLFEICSISRLPNLEDLILWNCHNLVYICETIGDLRSLAILNMTGCENLFISSLKRKTTNPLKNLKDFFFGSETMQQPSFPLPRSLKRVFLKDCYLEITNYFPLSFSDQSFLQYLNLGNCLFELLPSYNHLRNLRVLDLSLCSRLICLVSLPNTLNVLYVHHCKSLVKITFESHRFTLQELGYEGCINLSEIEGLIKMVPLSKLDENDLGHMKWLKEYQKQEVRLVGDDELTKSRSQCIQVLYEFNIMSTSLLDKKDPSIVVPIYTSESSSLSFQIPSCPKYRKLKGLNVTIKYTIIARAHDWVWFAKISTTNGVKLMYSPKVFGKPESGESGIWLSYWPIGNTLNVGDKVDVSIFVMSGLEVLECGASIVYADDNDVMDETLKNKTGWVESIGGDELSEFQLSTGAYYLCRHDFYKLTEVGRLSPGWLSMLVGDNVDDKEIQGWRNKGRIRHLQK